MTRNYIDNEKSSFKYQQLTHEDDGFVDAQVPCDKIIHAIWYNNNSYSTAKKESIFLYHVRVQIVLSILFVV